MAGASPDAPGSRHWAAIGSQSIDLKCTHFGGRFGGRGGATVLYRAHHPMEEVHGFSKSH